MRWSYNLIKQKITYQDIRDVDSELEPCLSDSDTIFMLEPSEPIEPLVEETKSLNIITHDFGNYSGTTRRPSDNVDNRIDSVLAGLIEQRIQTKALPLALRKRLMYERARSG